MATGNPIAAAAFAGAFVGLAVPTSATGLAVGGGLFSVLKAAQTLPGLGAFSAGFAAGQAIQAGALTDFEGVWDLFGDRPKPAPPDVPDTGKILIITPDTNVFAPNGPGFGVGGPPIGCSPAALAAVPVDLGRRWLLALVPIQLALALCWLLERSRHRR
jgi:hypothetical protein